MAFTERDMFLLDMCEILSVDMSFFRNPETGVLRTGIRMLAELQMQKVGIYSLAALGRRMGLEDVSDVKWKLDSYDRQAQRDNVKFEEFQSRRSRTDQD